MNHFVDGVLVRREDAFYTKQTQDGRYYQRCHCTTNCTTCFQALSQQRTHTTATIQPLRAACTFFLLRRGWLPPSYLHF